MRLAMPQKENASVHECSQYACAQAVPAKVSQLTIALSVQLVRLGCAYCLLMQKSAASALAAAVQMLACRQQSKAQHSKAKHNTAKHSTAQHSKVP